MQLDARIPTRFESPLAPTNYATLKPCEMSPLKTSMLISVPPELQLLFVPPSSSLPSVCRFVLDEQSNSTHDIFAFILLHPSSSEGKVLPMIQLLTVRFFLPLLTQGCAPTAATDCTSLYVSTKNGAWSCESSQFFPICQRSYCLVSWATHRQRTRKGKRMKEQHSPILDRRRDEGDRSDACAVFFSPFQILLPIHSCDLGIQVSFLSFPRTRSSCVVFFLEEILS